MIPNANPVSLDQVKTELNISAGAAINMNSTASRFLAQKTTAGSAISLSDYKGKSIYNQAGYVKHHGQTAYISGFKSLGISKTYTLTSPSSPIANMELLVFAYAVHISGASSPLNVYFGNNDMVLGMDVLANRSISGNLPDSTAVIARLGAFKLDISSLWRSSGLFITIGSNSSNPSYYWGYAAVFVNGARIELMGGASDISVSTPHGSTTEASYADKDGGCFGASFVWSIDNDTAIKEDTYAGANWNTFLDPSNMTYNGAAFRANLYENNTPGNESSHTFTVADGVVGSRSCFILASVIQNNN